MKSDREWRTLLGLVLAQRLELNAIEGALKSAGLLSDPQLREIRKQAADTATAWSSRDDDDVLALIRIHGSPDASMNIGQTPRP